MDKPEARIKAIPRPIGVAYILEDGADAHAWLSAIFAHCFGRDGGRQSLIVPIQKAAISDRYQQWLRSQGPDVVLLATYDNEHWASAITDLVGDAELIGIERRKDEPVQFPRIGLERPQPLTSLSWIPLLKAVSGFQRTPPTQILDRYPRWEDDGLIGDNFGTLQASMSQFPIHEQIGLQGFMLTPRDAPANRWNFGPRGYEVEDAHAVLPDLARGDLVTLSMLSNLSKDSTRPRHAWSEGFCLVVGDSLDDRISCWNAGLLFDGALRQRYCTLRVPASYATDKEKIENIGTFLRNGNWIGDSSGPARVVVRSHTLDQAALADFIDRLREHARANVAFEPISSLDDCTPVDPSARHFVTHSFDAAPSATEAPILGKSVAFATPQPAQVAYCRGLNPVFSRGAWLNDIRVDRLNDVGRFSNERQHWVLPPRRQLVHLFSTTPGTRLTAQGILAVPATIESATLQVTQPDDQGVFHSLFADGGTQHFEYRDLRSRFASASPYVYAEPSDKGGFLRGLVGLFGSLNDLEDVLSNHFWRTVFLTMAAPAQSQQEEVIRDMQLRMRARDGVLKLEQPADWEKLAERIIQKSARMRVPRLTTRYDKLLDAWTRELEAAIGRDSNLQQDKDRLLAARERDLQRSLGFLLERGILFRGHEWVCEACRHRNWRGIDALKEVLACEVCGENHLLPAGVTLDFQMNEFLATCLREHDTLSVAAALCTLRRSAKRCFLYAPQTALYDKYPDGPRAAIARELDVVCISDGKLIIGEAKIRSDLIARSDIEDLAAAAVAVNADKAVLVAMQGDPQTMKMRLAELKDRLPAHIEAASILSPWDDQPAFYL